VRFIKKKMNNPYVLIATHNRINITETNIRGILKSGANVILVVSSESEQEVFKAIFPTIRIELHPNNPLGEKWQHGVQVARELEADPLIVNGSDDLLSGDFFGKTADILKDDFHFIGLKSWYIYDMRKVHRFNYMANLPLGGGRVYSKKMLERINYSLFDKSRDRHLDDLGYGNVLNSKLRFTTLDEPMILSVKGDWPMMNPAHKLFNSVNARFVETFVDVEPILRKFNYVRH
jgi:hypothetical protein